MTEEKQRVAAADIVGLTKIFKPSFFAEKLTAVSDLSFTVGVGEVFGLIGPNGSGKSTTMKILLGLISPTFGKTQIFGSDSDDRLSREQVGFLPENPYFYKHLTGAETIDFFGKLCGLSGAKLRARREELLDFVGLEDAGNRRLGGYSKGMLQRIGLAQAMVHDPKLLVLDEPTAGVDPSGSRRLRDLILEMKQRGKTIILCSHLLEQVQEVCDRVAIMNRGKLVRCGLTSELISIENQTEIIVENASESLLEKIKTVITDDDKAQLLSLGHPKTTLERLFLAATKPDS